MADPELRHTPNDVAVASFRLAVERDFKDQGTGERPVDFINVVAWRQTGEFVSRYLTKGRMAIVEGRLQIRDYTDRDGNKRTIAEVVSDHVYFGDTRKDGEGAPAEPAAAGQGSQFAELQGDDGELPFEHGLCLPSQKAEREEEMEETFEGMMQFHTAAYKAIQEPDRTYPFVCPICGGEAHGGKAGCNNHIHASCSACGFTMMQ